MGCCSSKPTNVTDIPPPKKKPIEPKTEIPEQSPPRPKVEEKEAPEPEVKAWKAIPIPDKVKVNCHPHELHKFTDTTQDDWMCNGIEIYEGGCYSGITDFHQTTGIMGWRCPFDECDFDICIECIQYDKYIQEKQYVASANSSPSPPKPKQ